MQNWCRSVHPRRRRRGESFEATICGSASDLRSHRLSDGLALAPQSPHVRPGATISILEVILGIITILEIIIIMIIVNH